MAKCPAEGCKNGKMTIIATTIDEHGTRKEPPVEINCIWCGGLGDRISKYKAAKIQSEIDAFKDAWCKCEEPGEPIYYEYDNGAHGYDCGKCGKILQTGQNCEEN